MESHIKTENDDSYQEVEIYYNDEDAFFSHEKDPLDLNVDVKNIKNEIEESEEYSPKLNFSAELRYVKEEVIIKEETFLETIVFNGNDTEVPYKAADEDKVLPDGKCDVNLVNEKIVLPPLTEFICKKSSDSTNINGNVKAEGEQYTVCKLCSTGFKTDFDLKNHTKFHCSCALCNKVFVGNERLQKHIADSHIKKDNVCEKCYKSFKYPSQLKAHAVTHNDIKRFKCEQCSKTFFYSNNYKSHMSLHKKKQFECGECGLAFVRRGFLKNHITIKHSHLKSFKCPKCEKSFDLLRQLDLHINLFHTNLKPYKCPKCDETFSYSMLGNQICVHACKKRRKCDKCNDEHCKCQVKSENHCLTDSLEFAIESKESVHPLAQHVNRLKDKPKVNCELKPYKCPKCGETFSYSELGNKICVHTCKKVQSDLEKRNVKNSFECAQSDEPVSQSGQSAVQTINTLENKPKIHYGVKPFKCKECKKAFTLPSNLENHMLIHSGVKNFQCEECKLNFSQYRQLSNHMRIHAR